MYRIMYLVVVTLDMSVPMVPIYIYSVVLLRTMYLVVATNALVQT